MKWIYGIKNKLTASIVLLALCLLVLLSNYLDRLHTENVKNSISTMYEDRLIVEEYILKMTQNTYQIREILIKDDFGSKESTLKKLTENIEYLLGKLRDRVIQASISATMSPSIKLEMIK